MDIFYLLQLKFNSIRNIGWIKSLRIGSTGIGYTFESLIGKSEDSLCYPDFNGIEIKTQRISSKSYISLFNYNPVGCSSYELKRILLKYGYLSPKYKNRKILNTCVYCNYPKSVGSDYKFSLDVDNCAKKIYLLVFDKNSNLIERESYWTFESLKDKLYTKIRYLAFVEAESKCANHCEYFRYSKMYFYILKNFDTFIYLIKISKIRVSFLSSYDWINDEVISHGVSFGIKPDNLRLLFNLVSSL